MEKKSLNVFIIYARLDIELKEELAKHFIPLERKNVLKIWSDSEIKGGDSWEKEILQNLREANVVLPLVSSNFFASTYIDSVEMREAITRHYNNEILLVPIIIKNCAWYEDDLFKVLQVLPKDGKAVDSDNWRRRDDAWENIVTGLKLSIKEWEGKKKSPNPILNMFSSQEKKEELNFEAKREDIIYPNIVPPPSFTKPKIPIEIKPNIRQEKLNASGYSKENYFRKVELPEETNEEVLWADAIKKRDIDLIFRYLELFSEGKYKKIAIAIANKNFFDNWSKTEEAVKIENDLYENVVKFNTIEKCNEYLTRYKNGTYVNNVKKIKEEIIKRINEQKRENFLYRDAIKRDSIVYYKKYLDKFEKGTHFAEIKEKYELKLKELEIENWSLGLKPERVNMKFLLKFYNYFKFPKHLNPRKNDLIETAEKMIEEKMKILQTKIVYRMHKQNIELIGGYMAFQAIYYIVIIISMLNGSKIRRDIQHGINLNLNGQINHIPGVSIFLLGFISVIGVAWLISLLNYSILRFPLKSLINLIPFSRKSTISAEELESFFISKSLKKNVFFVLLALSLFLIEEKFFFFVIALLFMPIINLLIGFSSRRDFGKF